jgi:MEDS: MEthanogen/methylotroph, DcmR Sensory domain
MTQPENVLRLAGAPLDRYRHVCAFFHSRDEENHVLLPFVKEGIELGQKVFEIVDPELRQEHVRGLAAAGLDVDAAERRKQLEVRVWEEIHLRRGCFDQEAMLQLIQEILDRGQVEGFPLTRFVARMEWALEDCPGVTDIVEYEARLNYVLPRYKDPVICTYDLARFSAGTVIDILRTHPVAIIGSILQENPFFMPPDEFLLELRRRTGTSQPV